MSVLAPTFTGTFKLTDCNAFAAVFNGSTSGKGKKALSLICTYVITCTKTQEVYVGATKSFYRRWYAHLWQLKHGNHTNQDLQALFDTWGEDAFTIAIVQHLDSTDGLELHEEAAAAQYQPRLLLNYRIGNKCKAGWSPQQHASLNPYRPKKRRGPNTVSRWFDFTGSRFQGVGA